MNKFYESQTIRYLNDPLKSQKGQDVAPMRTPQRIPYEVQRRSGIAVFYSLYFEEGGNFSGYKLTLVFGNLNAHSIEINPKTTLCDASGFLIPSYTYQALVNEAATLAGTHILAVDSNEKHKIPTSSRGGVSIVHAFTQGFEIGLAQGDAIRAKSDGDESRLMLRWANAYWLKNCYELQPRTLATGVLYFPAMKLGKLPLHLTVETGIETFEFSTKTNR